MKQIIGFLAIFSMLLFISCSDVKNIAYLQKSEKSKNIAIAQNQSTAFYNMRIKPKDILSITVVSSEPEASKHYNLTVPEIGDQNMAVSLYSQPSLQTYIVDNDGNIHFPVLGILKISSLTCSELEAMLQKKMASSFSTERPIITIRIINYVVNILGEVSKPGRYTTQNERLTIFEALANAGDLTIYGRRENVKILRENANGVKTIINVNLNDENIINSEGYFLEQNDVVYVEPNKTKSKDSKVGTIDNLSVSAMYILISITSLVVTLLKK